MKIVFLLLALILLPTISAQTEIFSGKMITDQNKEIDGNLFRFAYEKDSEKLFAINPDINLIIQKGECKLNTFFKICFNYANFSHRNVTSYISYYEVDIAIFKFDIDISINYTIPAELQKNEEKAATITLKNALVGEMKDVNFAADFSMFEISNLKSCTLDGSTIKWTGTLSPSSFKTCTMSIKSQEPGTHSVTANVSYNFGYESISKSISLASVYIKPDQLEFSHSESIQAELTQPFHVNLSLNNIDDQEAWVVLLVEFPLGAKPNSDLIGFDKVKGVFKQTYYAKPNQTKEYFLVLKADSELRTPFVYNIEYTVDNVKNTISNYSFVAIGEPKPIIDIYPESDYAMPGKKFTVLVKLTNPSQIYFFRELDARMDFIGNAPIFQFLNRINPQGTDVLFSHTIVIPSDVAIGSTQVLKVSTNYKLNDIKKTITAQRSIIIGENGSQTTQINNGLNQNQSSTSSATISNTTSNPTSAQNQDNIQSTTSQSANQPSSTEQLNSNDGSALQNTNDSTDFHMIGPGSLIVEEESGILEGFTMVFGSFENVNIVQKIVILLGAIIVVVILVLFFLSYKRKTREKRMIEEATKRFTEESRLRGGGGPPLPPF